MALPRGSAHQWTSRFGRFLTSTALAAAAFGSTLIHVSEARAEPSPILWGAYIDGVPWDGSKLQAFESSTKPVSIIHFGQPWSRKGAYQPFPGKDFQSIRNHGSIPMLGWGSWDYCCGTDQPEFRLAAIASGVHDAYLMQWARAAKEWGHPFFLRFDWEMNGWWQFPWAEQTNGNQGGDYVRAWRHVHDIFTQQGATNATWVWCPNVSSPRTTPLHEVYPGDDYVDWTCMDGYNFGTDNNNEWQSFEQVFGGSAYNGYHNTYQQLVDLAPGKPIMIAETATSRNGGDAGAWVRDALTQQLPNRFPQIKALVWFNWNAGDPGLSWPIESSPATQSAFAASIASPYFASNQFGALESRGPIQPVGGLAQPAPPPSAPAVAADFSDLVAASAPAFDDAQNDLTIASAPADFELDPAES